MKKALHSATRILLVTLPFWLGYKILWKYLPLRNTLFLEMPEPTKFSRLAEKYDFSSFGAPIKAGFAKKDITPKKIPWLAGYYPPHLGLAVHDRLWVKALALKDKNGSGVVIVSCDLIGLLPDEIDKITDLVNNAEPHSILISASHTHSGPDTIGLWGVPPFSGKDENYMEFLRNSIVEAIDESVVNLAAGKIRFAQGEFPGYSSGREENLPDYGVSAMQVLLSSGAPVTLINFAVHADVVKSFYVSADFPYYLGERLARLTGGEVMFIPGAIGGVQPKDDNDVNFFYVRTLGEALADKAFQILESPIVPKKALITGRIIDLNFAIRNQKFLLANKMGMISNLVDKENRMTVWLQKVVIEPAEILTVPGELFPKIWWEIKPKMKGSPKFIFGLTNGELGYILSAEDFHSGKHKYHAGMSVSWAFGNFVKRALSFLAED